MATGKQVVGALHKHLGEGGTFVWKWYGSGSGWAWCNATVCWAFNEVGAKNLFYGGKKVSYCPTSIKWCEQNLAQIPLELAQAGDILYFDWDKNAVPNHIGFARGKCTHGTANTIEGNAGSPAKVRERQIEAKYIQAVFRPHYPANKPSSYKLKVDGDVYQQTTYALQHALLLKEDGILGRDTVKAIQKLVGVTADGAWGTKTTKALQKYLKVTVDGDFGIKSQKALQEWCNKINFPSKEVDSNGSVTKGQQIVKVAKELAWAYGTSSTKTKYSTGYARANYKEALSVAYPKREWSTPAKKGASCDVFFGVVCRVSGVDKSMPRGGGFGYDSKKGEQWYHLEHSSKWKRVSVTKNTIKDGDIIIYHKGNHKGHVCIYGEGKIFEAGYANFYPKTTKSVASRLSKTGKKEVRVYRAK